MHNLQNNLTENFLTISRINDNRHLAPVSFTKLKRFRNFKKKTEK